MVGKSLKSSWLHVRSVPNNLTLLRILSVPLLLLVFPLNHYITDLICAVLFSLAALTDFFDGFFARRFNTTSKLGEILDPIADKVLACAMLLLLCSAARLPALLGGLLIVREIAVCGLRSVASERGMQVPVESLGKWKTMALWVAIFCLIINKTVLGIPLRVIGMGSMWVALLLSWWSAYHYWRLFWRDGGLAQAAPASAAVAAREEEEEET